jgi:hypothetical protein
LPWFITNLGLALLALLVKIINGCACLPVLLNFPYQHRILIDSIRCWPTSIPGRLWYSCFVCVQHVMPLGCHLLQSSSIFLASNGPARPSSLCHTVGRTFWSVVQESKLVLVSCL